TYHGAEKSTPRPSAGARFISALRSRLREDEVMKSGRARRPPILLFLRAPDQEPEDDRQLRSAEDPRDPFDPVRVLRKNHLGEGAPDVAATGDHEKNSQEARDEARSHDTDAEGKQPESPEDLSGH